MELNGTENSNENGTRDEVDIGTDNWTKDLTPRQIDAIPYLVMSPNLSEGARLAEIGRTTLHRWLHDGRFRETLQRLRSEAAEIAHAELRGLMLKAAVVLSDSMEDPSPGIRLRAAKSTLHIGLKAADLKDLQSRIDILDKAFDRLQSERTQK